MVYMLQNFLHYTGDYISKRDSELSSTEYPEQNMDFLNKLLFVPYRNENDVRRNFRLNIPKKKYPEFDGNKGPFENFTRVLRFDLGAPYTAILVDRDNDIIVGDTREMLKYTIYPRYKYSSFMGFSEAHLPMVEWPEFNAEYNSERMWIVHVQNKSFIGVPAYVEYFKDFNKSTPQHDTILQPDPRKSSAEYEEERRHQDYLDYVNRAREKGYIIRADENGVDATIVVQVTNEDGTKKYITGRDAFFYIDTEDTEKKELSELGLWQ